MAGRTPRVQDRSGFHRDWGNYDDPASLLPNQPFNPLPASEHEALEPGDVCWALGSRYVCLDPGTAGGGDAVWWTDQVAALPMQRGFSSGPLVTDRQYWVRPGGDPFPGLDWTMCAVFSGIDKSFGEQYIVGTADQFINGGVHMIWDGSVLSVRWRDNLLGLQSIAMFHQDFQSETIFACFSYSDGIGELFVNGGLAVSVVGPPGTYTPGLALSVGASADGLALGARGAWIHGAGIKEESTDHTAHVEWYRAVQAAGVLVPDPVSAVPQQLWRTYAGNPSMGAWNPSEGADALNLFGSSGTLQQGLVPRWWASK